MFVTSETYTGALGGLAGADAICQEHADDAGWPGTFKAWLSSRTTSVSERFDRDFDDAAFVRTDGVLVANNWADLTDGTLLAAINRDEFRDTQGGSVWTNTGTEGNARGNNSDCNQWRTTSDRSRIGSVSATDSLWTAFSQISTCAIQYRLYCFQQVSFWLEAEQL